MTRPYRLWYHGDITRTKEYTIEAFHLIMIIVGALNILMAGLGVMLIAADNPTAPKAPLVVAGMLIGIALVLLGVLA